MEAVRRIMPKLNLAEDDDPDRSARHILGRAAATSRMR